MHIVDMLRPFVFHYCLKYSVINFSHAGSFLRLLTLAWKRWPLPLPFPSNKSQICWPRSAMTCSVPNKTIFPLSPLSSPAVRNISDKPFESLFISGTFLKKVPLNSVSMPSLRCTEYHRGAGSIDFSFVASYTANSFKHDESSFWFDFWLVWIFLTSSTCHCGPPLQLKRSD